jgi:hypothetical protein
MVVLGRVLWKTGMIVFVSPQNANPKTHKNSNGVGCRNWE